MENVSLKIEPEFAKEMEKIMKRNRYITKTEFIREALRDKMRELEKQEVIRNVKKVFGASKHKTAEKKLHKARESAFKELEKKFK